MPKGLRPAVRLARGLSSSNPFDIIRSLAYRGNAVVDLVDTLKSDKRGDLLSLARAGLNVAQPGTGDRLKELHGDMTTAAVKFMGGVTDAVIEEGEIWSDFLTHYSALKWGVVCIVGMPGQGKTEFLKKSLTGVWGPKLGYPIEVANFYEGEEPPGAERISPDRLIARIQKVDRFIRQESGQPIDDGLTPADFNRGKAKVAARHVTQAEIDRMSFRLIGIDEGGMFFSSLGAAGGQNEREAAKRWADQIRHLRSILCIVAQKLSDIPPAVRTSAIMIYKYASPDVMSLDFKPGNKRDTQERWAEAYAALQAIKVGLPFLENEPNWPKWLSEPARVAIRKAARAHDTYWHGPLADIRSWGYCVAPTLGGHGIRTIFPFTPLNLMVSEPDDYDELDEGA